MPSSRTARVIQVDPERIHEVMCPGCGHKVGDALPVPSLTNKYRCRHCGLWFILHVPSINVLREAIENTGR